MEAALASRGVDLEVVVMDDHSTDRTVEIVQAIAAGDPRVRVETAPALPQGWAGKQHACHALAAVATRRDPALRRRRRRAAPDGVARAVGFLEDSGADLVSGFPRQITGTLDGEAGDPADPLRAARATCRLPAMRRSTNEAFAAGCGQLFVARREAYERAGGHATIRATFHDGLQLPRAFRRAGLKTDLFDATRIATCRMYHSAGEVIRGLAKNAHEGMAGKRAIWIWSALLARRLRASARCSSWPARSRARRAAGGGSPSRPPRSGSRRGFALAIRFRQSWSERLLHPLGISLLVAIQWYSWFLRRAGRGIAWKDRAQADG